VVTLILVFFRKLPVRWNHLVIELVAPLPLFS
jgi:hypothetical protein